MVGQSAARDQKLKLNLEKLRLKRGVSLDAITEATKISRRFLQAIEEEEFEKLPGGVFNTNYLRQYAAAAGFDESKLLAFYHACTREEQEVDVTPKRPSWVRWFRAVNLIGG